MIESITISNVATFGDTAESLNALSTFNFIYGANGAGKTTISKVIAEDAIFQTCVVCWKGGTKLQAMVYNRDFISKHFTQRADLKGIFTLGEDHIETARKIAEAKEEVDKLTGKIQGFTKTLQGDDGSGGKKGELAVLEESFKDTCWKQKQKHDGVFFGPFEGVRNSADKFKARVLKEKAANNAALEALETLQKKADTLFGATPTTLAPVPSIDGKDLLGLEKSPILKKRVIGKSDVDIAAMILRLGNSDWVKQGRAYYDVNDQRCPFCQQATTAALAKSLNEYFDETFAADTAAIEALESSYSVAAQKLQQQLANALATTFRFLDIEKLKAAKELVEARIVINNQRVRSKKSEPSQVVELEALSDPIAEAAGIIAAANQKVAEHNRMVANLAEERKILTAQVWKYIVEGELKNEIVDYEKKKAGINSAITSLNDQITKATGERTAKEAEIRTLEKSTTSIQPTIDGINGLLMSFGFRGFKLAKGDDEVSYKLIRMDGSDAKETLSEGEKTFVTFLYFYHLLRGSMSESGMTSDRVVVFDDPVSSLDSDILFIVSSLIKVLCEDVRAGKGTIKQIFVMTHNVYFHKEVTFNANRRGVAMKEETFWTVRKCGDLSKIEKHASNPITTSYDLLWSEVRRTDRSNHAIQNTLRRILENYFKILGGVDTDKLCAMFDGKEKLACRSLCSWVNDGSHFAQDDLYVSIDDAMVEMYLDVFKAVFEKSGHGAHYRMMMGDGPTAETVTGGAPRAGAGAAISTN